MNERIWLIKNASRNNGVCCIQTLTNNVRFQKIKLSPLVSFQARYQTWLIFIGCELSIALDELLCADIFPLLLGTTLHRAHPEYIVGYRLTNNNATCLEIKLKGSLFGGLPREPAHPANAQMYATKRTKRIFLVSSTLRWWSHGERRNTIYKPCLAHATTYEISRPSENFWDSNWKSISQRRLINSSSL